MDGQNKQSKHNQQVLFHVYISFSSTMGLYVQKSMTDTDFIDADIEKAERDLERLSAMVRSCIMMNASANLTEEAYTQQYTDLTRQYEEKKAEYESLLERKKAMEATAVVFSDILFRLTELEEIPIDFDEALWNTLVDHVTVYADERIVFSFMDGTEITEMVWSVSADFMVV